MSEVAVCIASYNRALLLKDTLSGLVNQTFKDFSVFICFDGSTDNICGTLSEYWDKLDIHTTTYQAVKSAGHSKSRAVSLALESSCKYIQMVDSDDIPRPKMLEKNLATLKEGYDWVLCWGRVFGDRDVPMHAAAVPTLADEIERNLLHSWVMAKREVFAAHNYRPTAGNMDDWDLWIRLIKNGYSGKINEEELYLYRMHQGSLSWENAHKYEENKMKLMAMNNIGRNE